MTDKKDRRGLGRGLSALMADVGPGLQAASDDDREQDLSRQISTVPIDRLFPNPSQPRRQFDQAALDDLAKSIRAKGILQPLIARPGTGGRYEIVAGERRWRAAQIAQLHEVPVLVRDLDDAEVMEVAIIENIQRADLNVLEEAGGIRQLMDRFGHTQEMIASALGKSRSHIANLLRLLSLPADVQGYLNEGKLTAGHARALITADDPSALARKVISRGLSVRETETLARKIGEDQGRKSRSTTGGPRHPDGKDADTRALEQDLSANLRMSVMIDHRPSEGGGQVIIRYKTLDDLDQLCQILSQVR